MLLNKDVNWEEFKLHFTNNSNNNEILVQYKFLLNDQNNVSYAVRMWLDTFPVQEWPVGH